MDIRFRRDRCLGPVSATRAGQLVSGRGAHVPRTRGAHVRESAEGQWRPHCRAAKPSGLAGRRMSVTAYSITLGTGGVGVTVLLAALTVHALMRSGSDLVDAIAVVGVGMIAALGWVLSYVSLRELALAHGEPRWAATLWPACLDLFALVAGLVAIRARAEGQRDRYAELLALCYSLSVIAGNVITVADPIGMVIRGVPAATMVLGWHLVLRRARPRQATATTQTDTANRPSVGPTASMAADPAMRADLVTHAIAVARSPAGMADMSCDMSGTRKAGMTTASLDARTSLTPLAARRVVTDLVREARAADRRVTTADVMRATGRGSRQARRLLNAAIADIGGTVDKSEAEAA